MTIETDVAAQEMRASNKKIDLSDTLYSYEVQKKRLTDNLLHNKFVITADSLIYTLDATEPTLYIAEKKYNVILSNLDDAIIQLKEKNNYFPKNLDISKIIETDSTTKITLNNLDLKKYNNEWSYFDIDTSNYDKLNTTQRLMAEKIHGTGNNFKEIMNMLKTSGINAARIYLLNPEYVTKTLKDNNATSLARLAFLGNFSCESYFDAASRTI